MTCSFSISTPYFEVLPKYKAMDLQFTIDYTTWLTFTNSFLLTDSNKQQRYWKIDLLKPSLVPPGWKKVPDASYRKVTIFCSLVEVIKINVS